MKLLLTEEIEFKPGTYSRCSHCSNYRHEECCLKEFNCDQCSVIDNILLDKDTYIVKIEVKE